MLSNILESLKLFMIQYGFTIIISGIISMGIFEIFYAMKFIKQDENFKCKQLKFRMDDNSILPKYASYGSSGLDLYSVEDITLDPGQIKLVHTGMHFEYIPPDVDVQIRSRSGLALKHGIYVLNSPGTIDSDYKEEVCVILFNNGRKKVDIPKTKAIAQMVICPLFKLNLLNENNIRTGGFGSTDTEDL